VKNLQILVHAADQSAVPEPSTLVFSAVAGLVGLSVALRRRRNRG
jgi:uncharacterized protein (TIGR03382 family)